MWCVACDARSTLEYEATATLVEDSEEAACVMQRDARSVMHQGHTRYHFWPVMRASRQVYHYEGAHGPDQQRAQAANSAHKW